MKRQKLETLVREMLVELGEDPTREGLERTPQRVAEALRFLTSGYRTDAKEMINDASRCGLVDALH